MSIKGIDYHVHTTCSDGVLSPEELIEACRKKGVFDIGITDHYGTTKYSEYFQVTDVKAYVEKLSMLRDENPDINLHIGLEVDFSTVYGQDPELFDYDSMNRVEYLLFEHVDTKEVEGNPVHGRTIEKLISIRNRFECPVGLAHNNFQRNFNGRIEEVVKLLKENNIFLELCEAEDKGKKVVDKVLLKQMMEIRKNFNSAFEVKEQLEKMKKQKSGDHVHMKHAEDGKYYFELFDESTWEYIHQYNLGLSLSSDSHKGLELGKCERLIPFIQTYGLENQIIFHKPESALYER